MASAKIAITMNKVTLQRLDRQVKDRVFANRSEAIQEAEEEKLERLERNRLARECAKLDPGVDQEAHRICPMGTLWRVTRKQHSGSEILSRGLG